MARPHTTGKSSVLCITVVNGDLSFIPEPLLIGHYRSARLTGTEAVMNGRIGGTMEQMLALGEYPSALGTHQIFLNSVRPEDRLRNPEPKAVIVVGLGEEGKLTGTALAQSVRQGVIAWVQRVVEQPEEKRTRIDLAATLIGSGGLGVPVGQSAQFIAQGVCEANRRLLARDWPTVGHLRLIELYLDRATEAWRALQVKATAASPNYEVTDVVQSGTGPLKRPLDAGYRGAEYDIISTASEAGRDGESVITYTLDTKRARSEVRATTAQLRLVRQMVERASNHAVNDLSIRKTLFKLLIPVELEPFLVGTTELQLQLTQQTAGIPWELLGPDQDDGNGTEPWAIRNKLLRKLNTKDFREAVVDASADDSILIIGEPKVTDRRYPRLDSAREEAKAVLGCFGAPDAPQDLSIESLISPDDTSIPGADADTIIKTLFARSWRIVHISGHGAEPELEPLPAGVEPAAPPERLPSRGVVLSDDTFLGPDEIRSLRVIPELAFLNCCHLARATSDQLLGPTFDRTAFAASVAEALINVGVRCVVAAGWAVEDEPARVFATTFYRALMRGARFIDAVAEARQAAYAEGGNTWAAYQCYGDPDWRFRRHGGDPQRPSPSLIDEFAGVASPSALKVALYTLAVRSAHQRADAKQQRERLRFLERRFAKRWGSLGAVAEAFAVAWSEVGDRQHAIDWYERARAAADGSATLKAAEQLANLRVRLAWEKVDRALRTHEETSGSGTGKELHEAVQAARGEIEQSRALLTKLVAIQSTAERESMLGSAYKRLAMMEAAVGKEQPAHEAVAQMAKHYENAVTLSASESASDAFYPAMNCLAAEVALNAGRAGWSGLDAGRLALVEEELTSKNRDNPDFWSRAGTIELSMYRALASGDLAGEVGTLIAAYTDLQERVPSPRFWSSVFDQARFVLQRYARRASAPETAAAQTLLTRLKRWRGADPRPRRRARAGAR